jgi:peptidoglycan/xylan/chitin deacetylase (PgdA/CDA1 family)
VLAAVLALAGCTAVSPAAAGISVKATEGSVSQSPPSPTWTPSQPPSTLPGASRSATPVPASSMSTVATQVPEPSPSPDPPSWPSPVAGLVPSPSFVLHVPILMYHRIVPGGLAGDSLPGLVVSPELFDAQLAALQAAGWHSVTVAQISQALQLGKALPPRTFAISIDDGWDDGYTYAFPILQRHGFHATYYVIAGRVGAWKNVLTPAELKALAAAGMEIGDHTLDHVGLPYLSPVGLHVQVATSADLLAAIVGKRPATFAYPSGRYDFAAEEEVQADGFGMAVIEGSGAWESAANRFAVPRVRVSPSTTPAGLVGMLQRLEPGS